MSMVDEMPMESAEPEDVAAVSAEEAVRAERDALEAVKILRASGYGPSEAGDRVYYNICSEAVNIASQYENGTPYREATVDDINSNTREALEDELYNLGVDIGLYFG
jgi:hypothetical protein